VGEIVNVHGVGAGAAPCDTVNVCPAIVIVPERAAAVLAAIATPTAPLPVPDAPLATVSHGAFDVAVQVQVLAEAVTATEPDPPASATSCVAGEIEKVHGAGGGAPCCDTVNVFPATAIVALRAIASVLTATVKPTLPLPLPEFPPRLIQGALVVAVHAQVFADAEIAIEPDPPAFAKPCVVGDIEKVHAGGGAAA
jgi:hypothetical protein